MARNRKRAKDRRGRQPDSPVDPRQGLPTATHDSENGTSELESVEISSDSQEPVDLHSDPLEDVDRETGPLDQDDDDEGAPAPLKHAMPDVELAEEQLAVGRPAEPEPDEGEDEEEFEREVDESIRSAAAAAAAAGGAAATMKRAPAHPAAANWPRPARRCRSAGRTSSRG